MRVPIGSWKIVGGACLVGEPNNLVVDAVPTVDEKGVQTMLVTGPSSGLCRWLTGRVQLHNEMKAAWEQALSTEKSQHSWWRLWQRLTLWLKEFPSPQIIATVTYFDFSDGDKSSSPTPWFTAMFAYESPPPAESFGVFSHLEESFVVFPGAAPKEVTLLLNPSPTFNTVLPQEEQPTIVPDMNDVFSFFGQNMERAEHTRAAFRVDYDEIVTTPITFNLKLADFWSFGGDCMIQGNFVITWDEASTPCLHIHQATMNLVTAYLADKIEAIKFTARGIDFFRNVVPGVAAVVEKPPFRAPGGTPLLDWTNKMVYLGFLTDPLLKRKFSRAKKILSHIRWQMAASVAEGILNPGVFFGPPS
ncbi:conserved hypothetical protein [Neospora caninum Liverpool]|nr:conserved hypothetical protein [Neospora caninum Liverpool]CBZ49990.1 conserved hypothetical protein [Neospora caninum Liverpool]|eukprot:XP_003880025.1 conserved hypothetical protein [Neospora caninum Liverpool]